MLRCIICIHTKLLFHCYEYHRIGCWSIKGEEPYQFVNAGKIQKMYVSEMGLTQLANGQLVLVEFHDDVKAVGSKVADKIKQRDESKILLCNENTLPDDDDPYADFQIPDDLMW